MKVKICGITTEEEVKWLNQANVDYAGFVLFFEKSKRNVSLERAKELLKVLDDSITPVAVTVEPEIEQIRQIEKAGFSILQVHGKIPECVVKEIGIPVWKAFNVSDLSEFVYYDQCDKIGGFVLDAQMPGSGKTFDWTLLEGIPKTEKQVMLAGGLNPDNIGIALRELQGKIQGVDTSSGVEKENGVGKDKQKIELFVKKVRQNCL